MILVNLSGSMTPDDVQDAPLLPKGHYYGVIRRFAIRNEVQTKNGPRDVVDFYVGLTQPSVDIDPTRIEGVDLSEFELQQTFWYTPAGMPELRDFIRSFKLPNAPFDALYLETVGRKVLCTVSTRTFKNRSGRDVSAPNLDAMVAADAEQVTDLSGKSAA